MATVTLKLKIDIPGLQQELDQAVKKILDVLGPLQKLGINIDDKEALAQLQAIQSTVKETGVGADQTREKFSQWGMIITGLQQGFQMVKEVAGAVKDMIMSGAEEQVLKANFKGTTEQLELFRMATAGTVQDGSLIKLSNQATDLGVSMEKQTLLFSLARDAANKYGGTVEEGFQKIVMASEGNVKGLKALGIQKAEFQQILEGLAEAQGEDLKNMDFEEQKQLRLQAILIASKKTMDDVFNTVQNSKEKWESMGVAVEESKEKIGGFISDGIIPLVDALKKTGVAGDILITTMTALGSVGIALVPIILQMKTNKILLKSATEGVTAATEAETMAMGSSKLALFGIVGVLALVTLGFVALEAEMDRIRQKMKDDTLREWVDAASADLDKLNKKQIEFQKKQDESDLERFKREKKQLEDQLRPIQLAGPVTKEEQDQKNQESFDPYNVNGSVNATNIDTEAINRNITAKELQIKKTETIISLEKNRLEVLDKTSKMPGAKSEEVKGPIINPEDVQTVQDLGNYLSDAGKDAFETKKRLSELWEVLSWKDRAGETLLGQKVIQDMAAADTAIEQMKDKTLSQSRELNEKSQLLDADQIKDVQKREETKAKITFLYLTNEVNLQIKALQDKKDLNEVEKQDLANLMLKKGNILKEYNSAVAKSDQESIDKQKKLVETLKDLDVERIHAELEIDKENLSKRLQLLDMEMKKRIDNAELTNKERQKIEEIYSQKRVNLIQSEIDTLSSKYEQHFQSLFSMIQTNLQQTEQTSQAEIKLNEFQYNQQQQKLQENLQKGEITKEEYDLQYRVNYEQHQKYLEKIDTERQGFISKMGKDIQKYLIQQLVDYLAKFISTKIAEATVFQTTEVIKTTALTANTAIQLGVSEAAAAAGTATTVASMAAIAVAAAPAAALTSIATFGIGTAVAIAGVIAGVAAIVALAGGFEEGGYTGGGDKKKIAGPVHRREYVFESNLVDGNEKDFNTLHQLLRSGMSLSEILNGLARQVNPILQPHEFLKDVNLSLPSQRYASGGMIDNKLMDEIKGMRAELKELKEKGMKIELVVEEFDSKIRGSDVYKSYKLEEKFQNNLITKKNV